MGACFLAFGFIAYIPYSRLLHIITTPANHFLKSFKPTGYIEPIRDFENAEAFGVGKLEEFTWKQIFDSDACTRCGRCQDGCPAYLTGKPLSPKKMVQDIKTYWLEKAPEAVKAAKAAKAGRRCRLKAKLRRLKKQQEKRWWVKSLTCMNCGPAPTVCIVWNTARHRLNMCQRLLICDVTRF